MKKICFFLFLCFVNSLFAQTVIPQPVEMLPKSGVFRLKSNTSISYNQTDILPIVNMFLQKIKKSTGYELPQKTKGTIQFQLLTNPNPTLGSEGYTLEVTPKYIRLSANQMAGLFYGLQTLYQLFPKEIESQTPTKTDWQIPCVAITDYPRFAWRGFMLDVSRHFFAKAAVKRFIDDMVRYKYNVFHWHLTDDQGWRIEIKSYPKLTQVGACRVPRYGGKFGTHERAKDGEPATDCGYYTQEDIREIVAYAKERFVNVLPEIDVPGHSMAAIAAYPELCCSKNANIKVSPGHKFSEWFGNGKFKMLEDNALNPADENVYVFLDKVFGEVATLFPYPYIHTGGDECYHGFWEENEACKNLMKQENLKNTHELQSFFVKKVEKIVQSKGKKLIGWDEILDGGLAPNAAVMSWQGTEGGIAAAKAGHYAVMTPNDFVYTDLIQGDPLAEPDATAYKTVRLEKSYSYEPMPDGVDPKYILGGQVNLWTEKVPTLRHAQYMTFPRAWALADVFWSPKSTKNWDNFVKRMERHFDYADMAQINYAKSAYDAIVIPRLKDGQLEVEIKTEINGLTIFYTLDETTPDKFTPQYQQPILIPEGVHVTLRVVTYQNGKQIGKIINFPREVLLKRIKK